MDSKTWHWKRFINVVLYRRRRMAVLLVMPLFLAPALAIAQGGTLSFRGQVTNPSCAVMTSSAAVSAASLHTVNVSTQVSIRVDTLHNACTGQVMPFTTHLENLPSSSFEASNSDRVGAAPRSAVVTLTYQ